MPTLFTQGHFASYLQSVRRMQNLPAPVSPFLDFVQQYTDSVAEQHQATQQQLVRYKFQNLVLKAMTHNVYQMNCSLLETNRELTDQLNELRVKQTNMMSSQVSSSSSSHVESELMTPATTFVSMNATQWKSFSIGVLTSATLLETSGQVLGHEIRPYSYAYKKGKAGLKKLFCKSTPRSVTSSGTPVPDEFKPIIPTSGTYRTEVSVPPMVPPTVPVVQVHN